MFFFPLLSQQKVVYYLLLPWVITSVEPWCSLVRQAVGHRGCARTLTRHPGNKGRKVWRRRAVTRVCGQVDGPRLQKPGGKWFTSFIKSEPLIWSPEVNTRYEPLVFWEESGGWRRRVCQEKGERGEKSHERRMLAPRTTMLHASHGHRLDISPPPLQDLSPRWPLAAIFIFTSSWMKTLDTQKKAAWNMRKTGLCLWDESPPSPSLDRELHIRKSLSRSTAAPASEGCQAFLLSEAVQAQRNTAEPGACVNLSYPGTKDLLSRQSGAHTNPRLWKHVELVSVQKKTGLTRTAPCAERICQPGPSIKGRGLSRVLRSLRLASAWAEPRFCSTEGHNQHPASGFQQRVAFAWTHRSLFTRLPRRESCSEPQRAERRANG